MADIKKLQSVGICTVKGVMMTTKKRLAEIKGLSEAKVDKIKEASCKIMVIMVPFTYHFLSFHGLDSEYFLSKRESVDHSLEKRFYHCSGSVRKAQAVLQDLDRELRI